MWFVSQLPPRCQKFTVTFPVYSPDCVQPICYPTMKRLSSEKKVLPSCFEVKEKLAHFKDLFRDKANALILFYYFGAVF